MHSQLSPRDQVADFQAAYVHCIDHDRLEAWPDFFEERCHYCVTTADNVRQGLPAGLIWANSRAMLHDRVSALRHANVYERQGYRHILGLPFVTGSTELLIEAETPFLVARIMHDGETDLFVTGIYRDSFVHTEGGLKLRTRLVICDSSRIDTLLAVPL